MSVEREEDPELDDRLYVTLDRTGDTSRYRLSVVDTDPYGRPGTEPFPGFDQRYFSAPSSTSGPTARPPSTARTSSPTPAGLPAPRPSSTTPRATTTPSAG